MVKRGETYWVDLSGAKGSEQKKDRPAVILQNNTGNKHSPCTIVAVISTGTDAQYPVEVELPASTDAVRDSSIIKLDQIRTLDKSTRLKNKIGEVPPRIMQDVNDAIRVSLGII